MRCGRRTFLQALGATGALAEPLPGCFANATATRLG